MQATTLKDLRHFRSLAFSSLNKTKARLRGAIRAVERWIESITIARAAEASYREHVGEIKFRLVGMPPVNFNQQYGRARHGGSVAAVRG